MKTAAIIQARMGSTRLPGKVLMDIAGKSMLMRTVEHAQRAETLFDTIVATSDLDQDNAIVEECVRHNVPVFRGSETDVLDRYLKAAKHFSVDPIVRITSDCPLIEPTVIDRVVKKFFEEKAEFASNFFERTDPRGFDTEVMSYKMLTCVAEKAEHPDHREHPTLFVHVHRDQFHTISSLGSSNDSMYRLTVDTAEDLALIRSIYDRLGIHGDFGWKEIKMLLLEEPDLLVLNQSIRHKVVPGMTLGKGEVGATV